MSGSPTSPTSRRRRSLGQHFLSSPSLALRIVELFGPAPGETVIEIGPGRGALTGPLLAAGARVTAVEVDRRLAEELQSRFGTYPSFTLVVADILRTDISRLAGPAPARVLANLPYAITGEVLVRLFAAAGRISEMTLMLQREVVNRLVADPGGKVYGSLSVLAQYFTEPRILLKLGPGSFSPPPAVSSTLVVMPLRRARELSEEQERAYPAFVRMLFARRRRTLLNNLRAGGVVDAGRKLEQAGIAPARRPETLSRTECLRLRAVLDH